MIKITLTRFTATFAQCVRYFGLYLPSSLLKLEVCVIISSRSRSYMLLTAILYWSQKSNVSVLVSSVVVVFCGEEVVVVVVLDVLNVKKGVLSNHFSNKRNNDLSSGNFAKRSACS